MAGRDTHWWAFCPTGWAFCPHMGQNAHFWPKIIMSFHFYNIMYFTKKKFCIPKIWQALGYRSFSKIFIHWLLRYETRFLGWASCPTLPYWRHFVCQSNSMISNILDLVTCLSVLFIIAHECNTPTKVTMVINYSYCTQLIRIFPIPGGDHTKVDLLAFTWTAGINASRWRFLSH